MSNIIEQEKIEAFIQALAQEIEAIFQRRKTEHKPSDLHKASTQINQNAALTRVRSQAKNQKDK